MSPRRRRESMSRGVKRALELGGVPHEKWTTMLQRTIIGIIFTGAGGLILFGQVAGTFQQPPQSIQITVFGIGAVLLVLGPTVWSTQIVTKAFKAIINPARTVRELLKGSADTPPPGGTDAP